MPGAYLKPSTLGQKAAAQDKAFPCPFCRDEGITFERMAGIGFHQCNRCGATGPIIENRDVPKDRLMIVASRALWNTRLQQSEGK